MRLKVWNFSDHDCDYWKRRRDLARIACRQYNAEAGTDRLIEYDIVYAKTLFNGWNKK